MYRADLVRSSKEFYPNASPHADTSACFRDLQKSDFGFVYQVLCFERTHEATQSTASAAMNRYSSAILSDLKQYGSFYLSKDELNRQVNETLNSYHRFLALNYVMGFRDKKFWDYHRGRLAELGYPLSRITLLKAVAATLLHEARDPGRAIRKIWRRVFPKRANLAASAPSQAQATDRR
jgi:hypothetical protein